MLNSIIILLIYSTISVNGFININGTYGVDIKGNITHSSVYEIKYSGNNNSDPVKVVVQSTKATMNEPLLVVIIQEKRVFSWNLPFQPNPLNELTTFHNIVGHTLCPSNNSIVSKMYKITNDSWDIQNDPVVIIKSPAKFKTLDFTVRTDIRKDFYLKLNRIYETNVSATIPAYYYYNFKYTNMDENEISVDAIKIQITSESNECMIVSLQTTTCPVYDMESNIKFDSYWQTMTKNSSIVVTRKKYPHGFYLIMVVKEDNEECGNFDKNVSNTIKPVSFKLVQTISEWDYFIQIVIGTVVTFSALILISIVGVGTLWCYKNKNSNSNSPGDNSWCNCITLLKQDKSSVYLWQVVIVICFYIIPVIHVIATYVQTLHKTGNDDLCYYNFLCAFPITYVNDVNHVLSNIGYVSFGIIFLFVTCYVSVHHKKKNAGMFYALSLALILEGILSAGYHFCPKASNFLYDTCFMYVMVVLMIINIYEKKITNPDSNGYGVFGVIGVTNISAGIAYIFGEPIVFWVVFGIIQLVLCMILIYVFIKLHGEPAASDTEPVPKTKSYCIYTTYVVTLFINIGIIILCTMKELGFGSYLLFVLIANAVIYFVLDVAMICIDGKKLSAITIVFGILSIITWILAVICFTNNVIAWEKYPAESRLVNKDCYAFNYDYHDFWHFLSALALFFTFLALLTLNNNTSEDSTPEVPNENTENNEPLMTEKQS